MAKMRVYELADDLDIPIPRAVELLREVGAEPVNHMSVVERVPARRVRQLLKQNKNAAVPQARSAAAPVSPTAAAEKAVEEAEMKRDATQLVEEAQASPAVASDRASDESADDAKAAAAAGAATAVSPLETPERQATDQPSADAHNAARGDVPSQAKPVKSTQTKQAGQRQKAATPARQSTPSTPGGSAPRTQTRRARTAESTADVTESPAAETRSAKVRTEAASVQRAQASADRSASSATAQMNGQAARSERQKSSGAAAARKTTPQTAVSGTVAGGGTRTRRTKQRSRANAQREQEKAEQQVQKPQGPLVIPDTITVQELADRIGVPATTIIKSLMQAGVMASINQSIDHDAAAAVAEKLGYEVARPEERTVARFTDIEEDDGNLVPRPPVVTIMGHVDHGKTTLLDAIRHTRVVEKEAGGITQHIGAYQVEVDGKLITFLDTPGHEVFTAMRSRGAQVTDIAVLVVAADDGVMPQTIEAINHAKAADVPILVAINKIDRPAANVERVKQQLVEHGLIPEEWGGDTICVPVSAITKEGLDTLLEMILLLAEIYELKANPNRPARGVVIEAELDRNRGPVATVLVRTGTLRVGDSVVAGTVVGRVRAMYTENGETVEEAGPSRPVSVLGFHDVPLAGDAVEVVADDKAARELAAKRAEEAKYTESQTGVGRIRLSEIFAQEGEVKDLNLILKADVQGSLEALRHAIEKLSTDEVRVNIVHAGVGGINESDVALAATSNAVIIGFNVRPETTARRAAEREGVEVKLYRVIYEAIDEIKAAVAGLLEPEYQEVYVGRAEVRALFRVPNVGVVAGAYVLDGKIRRDARVRVLRDSVVIHDGELGSLKRFKDDVREVPENYECGLSVAGFNDLKVGDIIEAYITEEVARVL